MGGQPILLASRSPQRRALLEQLGLAFDVLDPDVAELAAGEPAAVAAANARAKARAGERLAPAGALVLAADTLVALEGVIYGQPRDEAHARTTLTALAGATHEVHSAIATVAAGVLRTAQAVTRVRVRELSEGLLDWYLATGEWRGRAGAYAIQGAGGALVQGIDGDYTNVVGLPIPTLLALHPELLANTPRAGARTALDG